MQNLVNKHFKIESTSLGGASLSMGDGGVCYRSQYIIIAIVECRQTSLEVAIGSIFT